MSCAAKLVETMVDCGFDVDCVADPTNDLMVEYRECFTAELNPEEQVWSDRILRAWTNFVIHG